MVSPSAHGISLHLQNHDSLTFQIRRSHPNWREGVHRIYAAMGRPIIIRNKLTGLLETFTVGLESEVGVRWGKGLSEVKGNSLEAVELALQKLENYSNFTGQSRDWLSHFHESSLH